MIAIQSFQAPSVPPPTRRPLVKRGAVTMTFHPLLVCWNDIRVSLSPVEAELLAAVIRHSRVPWHEVNALLASLGCCTRSRDVLIHRIRRKFAAVGARDPIETVRGWGLRFRVERDLHGSAAFWIGASEDERVLAN